MTDAVSDLLAQDWRKAGLADGDTVLLHSNIKRLSLRLARQKLRPDPVTIVQSFLAAIGPGGTLLIPAFNFDFTRGQAFDRRTSPSQMGALSEAARTMPDAVRTGHPLYSFVALGAGRHRFAAIDNRSGYGLDSPFATLLHSDGKIAVLDLPDQNSMTFYHYVEECEGVDYRYHKTFEGTVVDGEGHARPASYSLFVRDIARGVVTDVGNMERELWSRGLYGGDRPGEGSGLRVIRARDIFAAVCEVIRGGRAEGMLYRLAPPENPAV